MKWFTDSELTGPRLLRIWWSLAWRGAVLSGLAQLIKHAAITWVTAWILGQGGASAVEWLRLVGWLAWLVSILVSIPISLWVLRSVLKKPYRDFSIRLVGR